MRNRLKIALTVLLLARTGAFAVGPPPAELRRARNLQDQAAIDEAISQLQGRAKSGANPDLEYRLACAYAYASEIAMEKGDKKKAQSYAESGLDSARKAVEAMPQASEYHRVLGQLCGEIVPANPLFGGLKYGQCARDEVNKAIQLDGKSALAYLSRGVGNYYLPAQLGGGIDLAIKDFDQAIAISPNLSEAYLWKGIALRKANRNGEAHKAIAKAVELSPDWVWAKEQLAKTPAQ